MLQVPTNTAEDAAYHSKQQKQLRDQPVVV